MECARRVSVITFIRYTLKSKDWKANNFKIFGSRKTKRPKQDSQNRLRSHRSPILGQQNQLFVRGSSCLIYVICVCLRIVVSNTYCVVFLFCFSSSCFSGLSIFDWSFCRLLRLFNANYINCFTHDHYLYFYLRWRDDLLCSL